MVKVSTTTMIRVVANVEIHQCAPTHTSMIHIHASASVKLTHVQIISTLTMIPVVVSVVRNQPAPATNTSMIHPANAIAVMFLDAVQENTTTMTHVNANVKIHQPAMTPTIMTQIRVNVYVDHMTATLASTLTPRAVAVSAQSTRPAQTINSSMLQLASVNAVM